MTKVLQDLINTGKVVSFIDDVIVGTEEEEWHNKVVEEIVKKLAEKDLYVKIKKKKVKMVLDQLTPKRIKNVQMFLGLTNHYRQFIKYFTSITRPLYDLIKNRIRQRSKKTIGKLRERLTK